VLTNCGEENENFEEDKLNYQNESTVSKKLKKRLRMILYMKK